MIVMGKLTWVLGNLQLEPFQLQIAYGRTNTVTVELRYFTVTGIVSVRTLLPSSSYQVTTNSPLPVRSLSKA